MEEIVKQTKSWVQELIRNDPNLRFLDVQIVTVDNQIVGVFHTCVTEESLMAFGRYWARRLEKKVEPVVHTWAVNYECWDEIK